MSVRASFRQIHSRPNQPEGLVAPDEHAFPEESHVSSLGRFSRCGATRRDNRLGRERCPRLRQAEAFPRRPAARTRARAQRRRCEVDRTGRLGQGHQGRDARRKASSRPGRSARTSTGRSRTTSWKKPFLLNAHFSRGIGTAFQLGGLPIVDGMVQFERNGDRIFLVAQRAHRRHRRRLGLSSRGRPTRSATRSLQAFKIESEKDSTVLIDMAPLFVSDFLDLTTRAQEHDDQGLPLRQGALGGHRRTRRSRRTSRSRRCSPSRRTTARTSTSTRCPTAASSRSRVHYSFSSCPRADVAAPRGRRASATSSTRVQGHEPRRQGRLLGPLRSTAGSSRRRIRRAALSEPKEPIVFYLDNTDPGRVEART